MFKWIAVEEILSFHSFYQDINHIILPLGYLQDQPCTFGGDKGCDVVSMARIPGA